jgi:hypothetical protein
MQDVVDITIPQALQIIKGGMTDTGVIDTYLR